MVWSDHYALGHRLTLTPLWPLHDFAPTSQESPFDTKVVSKKEKNVLVDEKTRKFSDPLQAQASLNCLRSLREVPSPSLNSSALLYRHDLRRTIFLIRTQTLTFISWLTENSDKTSFLHIQLQFVNIPAVPQRDAYQKLITKSEIRNANQYEACFNSGRWLRNNPHTRIVQIT